MVRLVPPTTHTHTAHHTQGLYYSYYKTLVNAHTLSSGLASLTSDNMTEYPSTINTLARFNLAPEVSAPMHT